jgi:hypothetical protein
MREDGQTSSRRASTKSRFPPTRCSPGAGAMKEIQIFSEGNPSRMGRESKPNGRKSKFKALISFAESSLINDLQRPPTAFSFWGRFRPQSRHGSASVARLLRIVSRSFCLRFSSSVLMKQVKGWRHFDRGRLDAICADLAAASLTEANMRERCRPRVPGREPGDRGAGKDRAIDPMSGKN